MATLRHSGKTAIPRPTPNKANTTLIIIMVNMVALISRCNPVFRISHTEGTTQASVAIISIQSRTVVIPAPDLKALQYMLHADVVGISRIYNGLLAVGVEDVDNPTSPRAAHTSRGNCSHRIQFSLNIQSSPLHRLLNLKKTITLSGLPKTYRLKTRVAWMGLPKTEALRR